MNGVVFGDYAWEAHYTHGETRLSTSGINNGNNQFHDAAQDAVIDPATNRIVCYNNTAAAIAQFGDLYPGCVPINTFGNNVTTDQQFDYWSRDHPFRRNQHHGRYRRRHFGQSLPVAGRPGQGGAGGRNALARLYDQFQCLADRGGQLHRPSPLRQRRRHRPVSIRPRVTQTLWDNNTLPSVHASENVWEFSGEIGIPILKDVPLVQSLDADLAGRYTNYSVSGAVQTWKVGLDWHVNDSVRFRGTTSVDIRAPTLNDLYSAPGLHQRALPGSPDQLQSGRHPDLVRRQPRPGAGSIAHLYGRRGADAELHSRPDHVGGLLPDQAQERDHQHQRQQSRRSPISVSHPAVRRPSARCMCGLSPTPTPRRPTIPPCSRARSSTRRSM